MRRDRDHEPLISKPMLRRFVAAYVNHSAYLAGKAAREDRRFKRQDIDAEAFGTDTQGSMVSLATNHKSHHRSISPERAQLILDACRRLLSKQHSALGTPNPKADAAALERRISASLGLPSSDSIKLECFLIDVRLDHAHRPEDLGFDDLVTWDCRKPWCGAERPEVRPESVDLLRTLATATSLENNLQRRLELAQIAVSLAMHCYPGTPEHEDAYHLALESIHSADLLKSAESRRIDRSERAEAIRLLFQLKWCRVAPHLDSPTNYLRYALSPRQSRMPFHVWREAESMLGEIIHNTQIQMRVDPENPRVFRDAASAVSLLARMMLFGEGPTALRRADALHAESQRYFDQSYQPYALTYPVFRALAQGNLRHAHRECEAAIAACRTHRDNKTAAALSALTLQILSRLGGTADDDVRSAAAEAVASNATVYLYSHIFDARETKKLLRSRGGRR